MATERLNFVIDADGAGARREFNALGRDAEASLSKADKSIASFSEGLANIGKGAAAGAALYGLATAASDLNEAMSAAGVVFGDAVGEIEAYADGAAETAGLSKRAALEVATGFATIGQSIGLADDDLAQWSTSLSQVSADLASFWNRDVADVAVAIQAGLRGEAEAAKSLGIDLSDATLKQELFRVTGERVKGTLSQAEKAVAAYAAIFAQTTTAQGDFARTAEGAANAQRSLKAEVENTAASLGDSLRPVLSQVLGGASDLVSGFGDLSPAIQSSVTSIGLMYAATKGAQGGIQVLSRGTQNAAKGISRFSGVARTAAVNTTVLGSSFGKMGKPITGVGLGVGAAAKGMGGLATGMSSAAAAASTFALPLGLAAAALVVLPPAINSVTGKFEDLEAAQEKVGDSWSAVNEARADGDLDAEAAAIDGFAESFEGLYAAQADLVGLGDVLDAVFQSDVAVTIGDTTRSLDDFEATISQLPLSQLEQLKESLDLSGSSEARDALNSQIRDTREAVEDQVSTQMLEADVLREVTAEQKAQLRSSGQLETKSKDIGDAIAAATTSMDDYRQAAELAASGTDSFAKNLDAVSGADDVIDSLQDLGDAYRDLVEDGKLYEDFSTKQKVFKDLPENVEALTTKTILLSEAQSDAVDKLQAVGDAEKARIAQLAGAGADLATVQAAAEGARERLSGLFDDAGIPPEIQQQWFEILELDGKSIRMAFDLTGADQALAVFQLMQSDIDGLTDEQRNKIYLKAETGDYRGAVDEAKGYLRENLPDDSPVRIYAENDEKLTQLGLSDFQESVAGSPVTTSITVDPRQAPGGNIESLISYWEGITGIDIPADMETEIAKGKIVELIGYANGESAVVGIDADDTNALAVVSAVLGWINNSDGTVTIDGNKVPAEDAANLAKRYIDSQVGQVTIGGKNAPAKTSANDAKAYVDSRSGEVKVGADGKRAYSAVDSLVSSINARRATLTIMERIIAANRPNRGPANDPEARMMALPASTTVTNNVYLPASANGRDVQRSIRRELARNGSVA